MTTLYLLSCSRTCAFCHKYTVNFLLPDVSNKKTNAMQIYTCEREGEREREHTYIYIYTLCVFINVCVCIHVNIFMSIKYTYRYYLNRLEGILLQGILVRCSLHLQYNALCWLVLVTEKMIAASWNHVKQVHEFRKFRKKITAPARAAHWPKNAQILKNSNTSGDSRKLLVWLFHC